MNRTKKILAAVAALVALALGGAALAGAAGGDENEGDNALTGKAATRAHSAALKATGGGKVNESERDGEDGATYEVEVTKPGGDTVDVRLGDDFEVVKIEGDSEEEPGDED